MIRICTHKNFFFIRPRKVTSANSSNEQKGANIPGRKTDGECAGPNMEGGPTFKKPTGQEHGGASIPWESTFPGGRGCDTHQIIKFLNHVKHRQHAGNPSLWEITNSYPVSGTNTTGILTREQQRSRRK